MNNRFEAGVSRVKITPALGTIINGDFVRYYAREIHDDLYAKALALSNGDTTLVIMMVDICVMKRELLDEVKKKIHAAFHRNASISADNIAVKVQGNEVILSGTVSSWAERRQAEEIALHMAGISTVKNQLEIDTAVLSD